jgi:hypothetical protein
MNVYAQVVAATRQQEEAVRKAQSQQLERLRYQAHFAERQFNRADPDNRLVTAELERRWELALQALREAEESLQQQGSSAAPSPGIAPELRQALEHVQPSSRRFAVAQALTRCRGPLPAAVSKEWQRVLPSTAMTRPAVASTRASIQLRKPACRAAGSSKAKTRPKVMSASMDGPSK